MVLANLFMYLFQISGSGHSSLETTSKHCVSCVNTSTTELLKRACSLDFWNWKLIIELKQNKKVTTKLRTMNFICVALFFWKFQFILLYIYTFYLISNYFIHRLGSLIIEILSLGNCKTSITCFFQKLGTRWSYHSNQIKSNYIYSIFSI